MKAIDVRCILLIISSFQYQRQQQERVISIERWVSLTTFNEDDCVERLRLNFSFIHGSLRVGLLKIYSAARLRRSLLH